MIYFIVIIKCHTLPVIIGGSFFFTSKDAGSSATLSCVFPYAINGSELFTCSQNAFWIGQGTCGNNKLYVYYLFIWILENIMSLLASSYEVW